MNQIILDRIKRQREESKPSEVQHVLPKVEEIKRAELLSPTELRDLIMNEIQPPPAPHIVETPQAEKTDKRFFGIEEFVDWYLPNQTKFTVPQQQALVSLIQARDAIFVGCSCKQVQRRNQMNEYFKVFWVNNQKTDLPATVLRVGNFNKVTLAIQNDEFLTFPLTQQ